MKRYQSCPVKMWVPRYSHVANVVKRCRVIFPPLVRAPGGMALRASVRPTSSAKISIEFKSTAHDLGAGSRSEPWNSQATALNRPSEWLLTYAPKRLDRGIGANSLVNELTRRTSWLRPFRYLFFPFCRGHPRLPTFLVTGIVPHHHFPRLMEMLHATRHAFDKFACVFFRCVAGHRDRG